MSSPAQAPAAPSQPGTRPLVGAGWMVITGIFFVSVVAVVRHMGDTIPPAQAAFLRYLIGLVFVLPALAPILAAKYDRRMLVLFSVRGFVHAIGVIFWFYAMARLPVAEVTAISYLAPIFVTLGAVVVFAERLAARWIVAIALALAGALIILRPGFRELGAGHWAMVTNSVFMAASYLLAKWLTSRADSGAIVGMLSITVTIALLPFALMDWVTPTLEQLAWLTLVAFFATAGHYTMIRAFKVAPMAVTQPVTFLQLVWATLVGVVLFAEPADVWVLTGGAVIIASVSYISYREWVLRREALTPPNVSMKT
ncbi:MAG: DMT family transporter [Rhodobacteraceae bacterium]|nr:DMT family transporter [Paracoccaceae bacterium]